MADGAIPDAAAPLRVDARGMRCPWPALRAARALRRSDHILVLADDPIAPGELAALAAQQECDFLPVGNEPVRTFLLRRKSPRFP